MGKITIITKYDGYSADIFVAAVACPLSEITDEQRAQLRRDFACDGAGPTPEDDEDASSLYFRECELSSLSALSSLKLLNADGEVYPD